MEKSLKKYLALALIFVLGISILFMLKGFLKSIAIAAILSYLFYPMYKFISKKIKSDVWAAGIVILFLFVMIVIPFSTVATVILGEVSNIDISPETINNYENTFHTLTGTYVSFADAIEFAQNWLKTEAFQTLPTLISLTSNFILHLFIVFFLMFYFMLEKSLFVNEVVRFLPFSNFHSKYLLKESGKVVRAILIGQVLTAIIQGSLGMLSLIIVGVEGAIFWGFIMIVLSLFPMIGAFIIWFPAGLFLLLNGFVWQGVFVLVWGITIVSQVDNFVRPKLVNKFADIHPVETFLGIFMGLAMFGLVGIIVGPLMISLFALLVKVFRKEHIVL